jgi:hypothetical protein
VLLAVVVFQTSVFIVDDFVLLYQG